MQEYSFSEKFFQIQPEGRIRRYQYLARSLFFGVSMYLIGYGISTLLGSNNIFINNIISLACMLPYVYVEYFLMSKRINDIGWKAPSLPKIVIGFSFAVSVIQIIVNALMLFAISEAIAALGILLIVFATYFSYFVGAFGLILLFYPGKKGDNEFGKDPIKTKVSFFG